MSDIIFKLTGGVHPPQNKHQSIQRPIAAAPIPAQLVIPMSQHIGPPSSPIVQVGDNVLKGQCIATAESFEGAYVHASTSGKVVAVEERPHNHASGMPALSIVIESDGRDDWQRMPVIENWQQVDRHELLQRIHEAGVIGMGGAGFPAASKMATDKPIHRSEERRVGKECALSCRSRWSPDH